MLSMQSQDIERISKPNEWRMVTLEDIASSAKHSIKRGPWGGSLKKQFFVNSGHKVYEQKNVIRNDFGLGDYYINNEKFSELKDFEISPGDVLISCSGTYGKVAIVPDNIEKGIINQALLKISLNQKEILTPYFKYLLESEPIQKYFLGLTHGSAIKNVVSVAMLKRMKFALPPILEQHKINSIISKVDELIQITDQIIKQTQTLKMGLMQRVLTRGIGHTEFKRTSIGLIPEKWKLLKLGDTLELCEYGLSQTLSGHGTYPIFRMNNILNYYMVTNDMKFIDLNIETFQKFRLKKGDILFNRTNSYELVGKTGIFQLQGDYTFASYLIRLRTKKEILNPFFLNFFLNMTQTQFKLKSIATPGVSQTNINASNLKLLDIPVPSISEQEEISSVILGVDNLKQNELIGKKYIHTLKKGVVQKLLTGKIRVKV